MHKNVLYWNHNNFLEGVRLTVAVNVIWNTEPPTPNLHETAIFKLVRFSTLVTA